MNRASTFLVDAIVHKKRRARARAVAAKSRPRRCFYNTTTFFPL